MKVNLPDPEEYAQVARNQKKYMRDLADKLEAGEPLAGLDAAFTAAVLRGCADGMSEKQPRPRGQPARFSGGSVALEVEIAKRHGHGANKKVRELAEQHDVSEEAIREAVRKYGKEAAELLDTPGVRAIPARGKPTS